MRGVVRNRAGLNRLGAEIDDLRRRNGPAPELVAADLIAAAALERRESRGGHFREDYPSAAAPPVRTVVDPSAKPPLSASLSALSIAAA